MGLEIEEIQNDFSPVAVGIKGHFVTFIVAVMPAVAARREKEASAVGHGHIAVLDGDGMVNIDEFALGVGAGLSIGIGDGQRNIELSRCVIND